MSALDIFPPSSATEGYIHNTAALPIQGNSTEQEQCTCFRDTLSRQHDNSKVIEKMETGNGYQHSADKIFTEMAERPSDAYLESSITSQMEIIPHQAEKLSLSSDKQELNTSGSIKVQSPLPKRHESSIEPPLKPPASLSPVGFASEYTEKDLPDLPKDADNKEDQETGHGGRGSEDSQSELQSIMGQFANEEKGPKQEDIMSPRLELAEQFFVAPGQYPPRKSSLEHLNAAESISRASHHTSVQPFSSPIVPLKSSPEAVTNDAPPSSRSSVPLTARPPPEPEPDQPFDFHRFLEQLRHRTADPVAKFLRSFLTEFGKKQWMVHEQVKIISDFLAFIANKMAQCEVWRNVSDAEFDNAKEGMEKLVMNRLYSQTFSPAIPPPPTIPRSVSRSKRKELERLHGPGRRGQHQEDVERDEILAQKIGIYSWIREEHLDIPPVDRSGRRFLRLAQQGGHQSLR
jgi:Rab5 GDP/GTP exchange factor